MISDRHHPYEGQVFLLYNALKLIKSPEDRAQYLAAQARVDDGDQIIKGALELFTAKLQLLRKKKWEEDCNLPDYPGNQEDTDAIRHIEKLAAKIKKRYAPAFNFLTLMIVELATANKVKANSYLAKYDVTVYITCDALLKGNDEQRKERIQFVLRRKDGDVDLKQTLELMKALRWTTRKALWDKNGNIFSEELNNLESVIDKLTATVATRIYDPGLYSSSNRSSSQSLGESDQKRAKFSLK